MEVNDRPKIHHPKGTPSITDHTFDNSHHGFLILFKLSGIFSMFNSRKSTDNDFIDGTPIEITPEGDDWNPNSIWFERNKDAYIDVHGQMIQKQHVDELLINDDNFMRDEWNQEYELLADIELIEAMYLYFVFTSSSVMYDKETEITSTMA